MTFKEFLKIEFWSKQTPQTISFGLGLIVLFVYIPFGIYHWIDAHRLTQGERDAARDTLQQIEVMKNAKFDLTNSGDRIMLSDQIEYKIEYARLQVRTHFDGVVATELKTCSYWYVMRTSPLFMALKTNPNKANFLDDSEKQLQELSQKWERDSIKACSALQQQLN